MCEMIMVCDGACEGNYNKRGKMSAGYVVMKLPGDGGAILAQRHIKIPGRGSNNQAELWACIYGVAEAKKLGATKLQVYTDSQLMHKQFTGEYSIKDLDLKRLHRRLREEAASLKAFDIMWHRRETPMAQLADALSKGEPCQKA
jgi:ribonuclease HI